jgi:hypothetical protein
MDANTSNCIHCKEKIHYAENRLLPEGGGVCLKCALDRGYKQCEECQDYFIAKADDEHFCDTCMKRIFERFV